MAKKPEIPTRSELKSLVRTTPLVTGFSYPFLRLITYQVDELHSHGKLFGSDGRTLTRIGEVLLCHIEKQLPLGQSGRWDSDSSIDFRAVALIGTAMEFLAVFEERPEEPST